MATTTTYVVEIDDGPPTGIAWGWFLASGIIWFLIGLGIMSLRPSTIALISWLVAFVVILAGLLELAVAFLSKGWRWLHALTGAAFIVVGVLSFLDPFRTFVGLAILFGWFLLLKGMVVFIAALSWRAPGSLWGLAAGVGVAYLFVGIWAIGYPGRSTWLLALWIGIGAVFHGVSDMITAFQIRAAR